MSVADSEFKHIIGDLRSEDRALKWGRIDSLSTGDAAYDSAFEQLNDTESCEVRNILDRVVHEYSPIIFDYMFQQLYSVNSKPIDDTYHQTQLDEVRQTILDSAGHRVNFVNGSDFIQFMEAHRDTMSYDTVYALMQDDLLKSVAYSLYSEEPISTDSTLHGHSGYSDVLRNAWQFLYARADSVLSYSHMDSHISDAEDHGMYSIDADF